MVPVAQRHQMETSLSSNPKFGPYNLMGILRILDIIVGIMFLHLPIDVMKLTWGVDGGAFSLSGGGRAIVGRIWDT